MPIRLREHKPTQQLYSSLRRPVVLHLHRLHHACLITAAQLDRDRLRGRQYTLDQSVSTPLCCCGIRWPGAQIGCRHRNVTIGTSCRDCCATAISFLRSDSACMQLRTAIPRSICRCSPYLTGTTSSLPPTAGDSAHSNMFVPKTHPAGASRRHLRLTVMAGSAIKDKTVVVTGANRGLGLEAIPHSSAHRLLCMQPYFHARLLPLHSIGSIPVHCCNDNHRAHSPLHYDCTQSAPLPCRCSVFCCTC